MAKKSASQNSVVIVESPAKARTIAKFLGKGYRVNASMGHVRDLARGGSGKAAFGIDFSHGYAPIYETIKGREKILAALKKAADSAPSVYLAPDPDREGEAIAWHLAEALKLPKNKIHRITFNAITKTEVTRAIEHPRAIDMNLVNAQQARRVLDRLVGFSLSPLLWKKVTKGLSAGRVQSVAVRMVVEREKEIRAFVPEEYWRVRATLSEPGKTAPADCFEAVLVAWRERPLWLGEKDGKLDRDGKEKLHLRNAEEADAVVQALAGASYVVQDLAERKVTVRPGPAFITSTLQQAAGTFLGFGTAKTMRVAQQLYEGVEIDGSATGLITYMRTDSFRIAPEALDEARAYIGERFAPAYLPEKPNFFRSKKGAQDAHEAIRPTSARLAPESVRRFLSEDQYRLYNLVWRRFVSSQMAPAEYWNTTATIAAGEGLFEARGRKVLFDGFTALWSAAAKKRPRKNEEANGVEPGEDEAERFESQELPPIARDETLALHALEPQQKFTQPPPRFSEASLVRALEKEGIGRPSTYAPIIQTIQERGYVRLARRAFHATELGMAVTDLLCRGFPDIMDYRFTAGMENDLDRVEEGEVDWVKMVDDFYKPFEARLAEAGESLDPLKGRPAPNNETCPECGSAMVVRYSQYGAFLSCGAYPECKGTRPLDVESDNGTGEDLPACPACGSPLVRKRGRFGEFLSCSAYPECKTTLPLDRKGKPVTLPKIDLACNLCGKPMAAKMGRRGPFVACTGYPECRNTLPLDKEGRVVELPQVTATCEKCGAEMTVRMSRRGPFLGCSAYPKCRNTKPLESGKKGEGEPASKKTKKETPSAALPEITVPCEECGKPMTVKRGRRGPFLGCSAYPKCRNTKPLDEAATPAVGEAVEKVSPPTEGKASDKAPPPTRKAVATKTAKRKSAPPVESEAPDRISPTHRKSAPGKTGRRKAP
ncbi:MAG: type I DNA topoisomerase [Planctomycetota bacterium]